MSKIESELTKNWLAREPWVVVDPDHRREWLSPAPLVHYVCRDKNGEWSVCDRRLDLVVHGTQSRSRAATIRRFYKIMGRPMPSGTPIHKLPVKVTAQDNESAT